MSQLEVNFWESIKPLHDALPNAIRNIRLVYVEPDIRSSEIALNVPENTSIVTDNDLSNIGENTLVDAQADVVVDSALDDSAVIDIVTVLTEDDALSDAISDFVQNTDDGDTDELPGMLDAGDIFINVGITMAQVEIPIISTDDQPL